MKYILSLIVIAAINFGTQAQEQAIELTTAPTPGPYISFSEMSFDFGEIIQGDRVEHVFEFTNTGDSPIIISNVKTTCGCTASSWPREPIAIGESSKIKVNFNSSGKIGHQNKVITIMSNATNNPERIKIVTNTIPKESTEGK